MYKKPCIVPTSFTTSGRRAASCNGIPTKTRTISSVAVVKAITRYCTSWAWLAELVWPLPLLSTSSVMSASALQRSPACGSSMGEDDTRPRLDPSLVFEQSHSYLASRPRGSPCVHWSPNGSSRTQAVSSQASASSSTVSSAAGSASRRASGIARPLRTEYP